MDLKLEQKDTTGILTHHYVDGVIMGNNKADDCQTGLAYTIEVFRKELQQSTTSGKVKDQKINEVIYKCGELK